MGIYILIDTVTREFVNAFSDELDAINYIRYALKNTVFAEDFEKDYKLYGKNCITMYGYAIEFTRLVAQCSPEIGITELYFNK
jgi:hypothetical protein